MSLRDIPGFEGRYAITDDGRVWSYPKKYGRNGNLTHEGRWKVPAVHPRHGYLRAYLSDGAGKSRPFFVHRLVAQVFLPPVLGKDIVNHKNLNKTDNRAENLEWCTTGENIRHAIKAGARNTEAFRNARRAVGLKLAARTRA